MCIIPNYTFATWVCLIQDKSAEVLLKYIENNNKIIDNVIDITNTLIIDSSNDDSLLTKAKNKTIAIFNEIFNYPSFYSYFDYFAFFPITNEIPYQVKRDYKILDNESKWLVELIKQIDTKSYKETKIQNICSWVNEKCDLNNKNYKEIIWELIKNNEKVLDLYRLTVMWRNNEFDWKIILVDNNFILEIEKHYWTDAISACNSSEWWFFEEITKAIDNIKLLNKQWEEWIQMWRDAWDLMLWKEPSKEALYEKELLRTYLSNEWISLQNQDILNDNLAKYNQWWLSINNNFISNTISTTFTKINDSISYWKDALVSEFFTENTWERIVINDIKKVTNNSKTSIDLKERISKLYNDEVPFATVWDISTERLRAKIIETHMSLDDSINILEKTIRISQKVCNSQDRKRGKCD